MDHFTSRVIGNKAIAESYYELSIHWHSGQSPLPGQFITLRGGTGTAPLLRRPFALSSYDESTKVAKIIYQKRGDATSVLSGKQAEEELDIIGPLGNSFPMPEDGQQPVLVAGGIGLGPILYLAKTMEARGLSPQFVFGARNRYLIPTKILGPVSHTIDLHLCTDDGSLGFYGTSVDYIRSRCPKNPVFYTCGPHPMMKAVHELSVEKSAGCWVSMEQVMACGVGACMGCAIETRGDRPFARVCADGPIFKSTLLVW